MFVRFKCSNQILVWDKNKYYCDNGMARNIQIDCIIIFQLIDGSISNIKNHYSHDIQMETKAATKRDKFVIIVIFSKEICEFSLWRQKFGLRLILWFMWLDIIYYVHSGSLNLLVVVVAKVRSYHRKKLHWGLCLLLQRFRAPYLKNKKYRIMADEPRAQERQNRAMWHLFLLQ